MESMIGIPSSLPPIEGRRALVTGAGNGLGRAIAHALVDAGAEVVVLGRTLSTLQQTRNTCAQPEKIHIVVADVADEDSLAAAKLGIGDLAVSILINNAGIPGPVLSIVDLSVQDWDEVFNVNVRGAFLVIRSVLPAMLEQGFGQIINIASVTGKRPLVRRTSYAASKMALIGLTRTLAAEVGPEGIIVNSLSPGPVRGPRMSRNFRLEAEATGVSIEEAEQAFTGRAALGRLVEDVEVATAAIAMLQMPGLCAADIDLSAGMIAP
jgi:NAD(P)-dependent dehydrogenase (short-subunit alcohol dehydrogenase family)